MTHTNSVYKMVDSFIIFLVIYVFLVFPEKCDFSNRTADFVNFSNILAIIKYPYASAVFRLCSFLSVLPSTYLNL